MNVTSEIGAPNAAPVGVHVHVPGNGTGGETLIAHPGSPTPVSSHADGSVGSPQRGSERVSASGISDGTHDAFPVSFDSGEGFASLDPSSQIIGERSGHGQAAAGHGTDSSSPDRRVAVEEAVGRVAVDAYERKTFEFRVRVREGVDLAVRGPMTLFESGLQARLETYYSGQRKWPLPKSTHPNLGPLQVSEYSNHQKFNSQVSTLDPDLKLLNLKPFSPESPPPQLSAHPITP